MLQNIKRKEKDKEANTLRCENGGSGAPRGE